MSKITFRAEDDLVERLDGFEASKSEVMREALRAYLDGAERGDEGSGGRSSDSPIDDVLADRVDALIADRLDALAGTGSAAPVGVGAAPAPEVNLSVTVEGASDAVSVDRQPQADDVSDGRADRRDDVNAAAEPDAGGSSDCAQCGEALSDDHVYCPNCGEKASRRLFCDCGDEVRSDWAFCPSCGRRTPAADVLDDRKPQYGDP